VASNIQTASPNIPTLSGRPLLVLALALALTALLLIRKNF